MKHSFLFLSTILLLSITAQAQKDPKNQTATFEDGTKIEYAVVDNIGDDQFRNTIIGFSQSDDKNIGSLNLMYERFDPNHFFASGEFSFIPGLGFGGIAFGGTYFFKMAEKNYDLPISIKTQADAMVTKKYVIKTPSVKNKHFGVNFEAGYRKYVVVGSSVSSESRTYALTSLSSGEIAIGFGYATTKQAIIRVENKSYVGGSKLFHLTADLMFFPGASFTYTTSDSLSAATPLALEDFTNGGVGFRLMLQGQTSFKFNKSEMPGNNFGFFYRLGILKSPYASPSGVLLGDSGMSGIISLGLFVNFGL